MSYTKTVLISFFICFAVIGTATTTISLLLAAHSRATGLAFSRRGLVELLLASLVSGWIAGSVWFLVRR